MSVQTFVKMSLKASILTIEEENFLLYSQSSFYKWEIKDLKIFSNIVL